MPRRNGPFESSGLHHHYHQRLSIRTEHQRDKVSGFSILPMAIARRASFIRNGNSDHEELIYLAAAPRGR